PSSTLFPYTTLFRSETFTAGKNDPWMLVNSSSKQPSIEITNANIVGPTTGVGSCIMPLKTGPIGQPLSANCDLIRITNGGADLRSEEHTSELQSLA